ncbi:DUF5060 domain-containing protein [Lachnoclostridium phytofermentans]
MKLLFFPYTVFQSNEKHIEVEGFYDGNGVYRIRFMPGRLSEPRYL